MNKKVQKIIFDWHQSGSIHDREGAGENYNVYDIKNPLIECIEEVLPNNGFPLTYLVTLKDGTQVRIFNPSSVVYLNK